MTNIPKAVQDEMKRLAAQADRQKQRILEGEGGTRYDVIPGSAFSPEMRKKLFEITGSRQMAHEAVSLYVYFLQHVHGRRAGCLFLWCDHTIDQIAEGAMIDRRRIGKVAAALEDCGMLVRKKATINGVPRVFYLPLYPSKKEETIC